MWDCRSVDVDLLDGYNNHGLKQLSKRLRLPTSFQSAEASQYQTTMANPPVLGTQPIDYKPLFGQPGVDQLMMTMT